MRLFYLILFSAMLFVSCQSENIPTLQIGDSIGSLTLELVFGADNIADEYLIAKAYWYPAVSENGDIFISDESKIKVYDAMGKPKMIIGGKGQGPGEFPSQSTHPTISPTGYLTVNENIGFTLFSPTNYDYIKNVRIKRENRYKRIEEKYGWRSFGTGNVITLDENTFVYGVHESNGNYAIAYETKDSIYIFDSYQSNTFVIDRYYYSFQFDGGLEWVLTDKNTLVYFHSQEDVITSENSTEFRLHIVDLNNLSTRFIDIPFTQAAIPDDLINAQKDRFNDKVHEKGRNRAHDIVDRFSKYPIAQKVFSDKGLIFVISYIENENHELLTYIIDIKSGKKTKTVWFPQWHRSYGGRSGWYLPPTMTIRNGKVYALIQETPDDFPEMRVYGIDPVVYEK